MLEYIVIRSFHFIAILALFSLLVSQHLLLKPEISRPDLKRIRLIDGFYGVAAIVVLAMGLLLWFSVGKPADFYTQNGIFHLKVTGFVVAGLLSVYPSYYYRKAWKQSEARVSALIKVPSKVILLVRLQLFILLCLPPLAVIMALGLHF